MTAYFKGKVIKHPAYVQLEKEFSDLTNYTKGFKNYWLNGYDPLIGKDGILPVPEIYCDNAIGRAHVNVIGKESKSYSSTKAAWDNWSTPGSFSAVIPTSNTFLIYCVDENRDACLLAYLFYNNIDSHKQLTCNTFRSNIKARAKEFYTARDSDPLPVNEHSDLFKEKWKIK